MFPERPPGHAALRRGRVSIPGQVYHLTTSTADRHSWFADFALARLAARTLNDPMLLAGSQTLCWVLMPDYVHWLIQLGEGGSLSGLIARFKQRTAAQINRFLGRCNGEPVWARAFHDHALRSDEDLLTVARYIVGNPIRAGLCASEREYSHWDCAWEWDW